MFKRLSKLLRRRKFTVERAVLREDGFDLYEGENYKGGVIWAEVEKIVAFKRDMVTFDLVCLGFIIPGKKEIFEINDDLRGYQDIVKRIKESFPDSRQDWESAVVRPAFARNTTTIYQRGGT
jgi:hypothetical protein